MISIKEAILKKEDKMDDYIANSIYKHIELEDKSLKNHLNITHSNGTIIFNNHSNKVCNFKIDVIAWKHTELPKNIQFESGNFGVTFSNNMTGWNIKGTSDSIIYVQRNQDIKNCTFEGKYIPIIITDGDDYWEITEDTPYLFEDGYFDAVTMEYTGKVIDEVFSNTIKNKSVMFKIPVGVDESFMEDNSIQDVLDIFEETISKYSKLYSKFSNYIDVDIDY